MRYKYRRYFLYYLGRVFAFLVYLLPLKAGVGIAAFLGKCAYFVLEKYRNIAIENLTKVFVKKRQQEISSVSRARYSKILVKPRASP